MLPVLVAKDRLGNGQLIIVVRAASGFAFYNHNFSKVVSRLVEPVCWLWQHSDKERLVNLYSAVDRHATQINILKVMTLFDHLWSSGAGCCGETLV